MPAIQMKTLEKSLTNGGKDATIGMGFVVQDMNDGASVNLDNANSGGHPTAYFDSSIPQMENKLTLTVEELAQQLNVSRTTAYNLARRKDFYPAFRIGHRLVVSVKALCRWLAEQTEG